jgi:hypothetical protein
MALPCGVEDALLAGLGHLVCGNAFVAMKTFRVDSMKAPV